jgi:hypothetical protein
MTKLSVLTYRRHTSGQDRVTLKNSVAGKHKDVQLGRYGSPESKAEDGRVIQRYACLLWTSALVVVVS